MKPLAMIVILAFAFSLQAAQDAVLEWNAHALDALRQDKTNLTLASRHLAMVHSAIFDAVNAVENSREPVRISTQVNVPVSVEAAVTAAAHRVLTELYPLQAATLDHHLLISYRAIPDGSAKKEGIKLGRQVAEEIIKWRGQDNSRIILPYAPKRQEGLWNPKPAQRVAEAHWSLVSCFALNTCYQFRPPPPPALESAQYAQIFYDVKRVGQAQTRDRSPDQTASALYWHGSTETPVVYWNQTAQLTSREHGLSLEQNAHLLALLNIALADAAIVGWDCKYSYCFWRPEEAIHRADRDGNAATLVDGEWKPLLAAPSSPEYVSGVSVLSGAASTILTAYFGDKLRYKVAVGGAERSFASFRQAAIEAGRSGVYAGIHFQSGNEAGLRLGRDVGKFVILNALRKREL